MPELFARPAGFFSLADFNKSTAEFTAPAATTKISAVNENFSAPLSASTLTMDLPEGSVINFVALTSVISVILASLSEGRTQLMSASAFACNKQGNPSKVSHRMQGLLSISFSFILTPSGRQNGLYPFALSSSWISWIRGSWDIGGLGNSLLR